MAANTVWSTVSGGKALVRCIANCTIELTDVINPNSEPIIGLAITGVTFSSTNGITVARGSNNIMYLNGSDIWNSSRGWPVDASYPDAPINVTMTDGILLLELRKIDTVVPYNWSMDIAIDNANLVSGSADISATMPRAGTLVDIVMTATETVTDTGHVFVTFQGTGHSAALAFVNPPDPPLAKGDSIDLIAQGIALGDPSVWGVPDTGLLPAGTVIQIGTNGLTNCVGPAAVTLHLIFRLDQ